MTDLKKPKYNRRLYAFTAIYLIFSAFMYRESDPTFPIRYGGFFLLTQLLVQVIFPQLRCSKNANILSAAIMIIGIITISLQSSNHFS